MVVLIVTGSMREPPLNCDIRGLERMFPLLKRDQYRKFKSRLGLEANINSPWIRESPFRFLTYKYRFFLEGRQWNCHSKFPIELPASSQYLVFTITFPVAGQWCRSQQLSRLTRQIVVACCCYSWWCAQHEYCVHVIT